MIELSITVPEISEFIKEIVEAPGRIFEIIRFNVRETVGPYLSLLMESKLSREFSHVLTAEGISRCQFCFNVRKTPGPSVCWAESAMKGPEGLSITETGLIIVGLPSRALI